MSEVVISAKNLSKDFRIYKSNRQRFQATLFKADKGIVKSAVKGVSLSVEKGERVAIIGNVASGRTTLIKMLAGMTYPTSGKVRISGDITAVLNLRTGFDKELTGRENLYIKAYMLGWTKEEIKAREKGIIEFSELESAIDNPVKSYTNSMKNRLGFAICLADKPEILLFDDPMSMGDKIFREKCLRKLEEYLQDENVTLVLVSNSPSTVKRLCSRAFVMEEGEIVEEGNASSVMKKYREEYRKTVKAETDDEEKESEEFEDNDAIDF